LANSIYDVIVNPIITEKSGQMMADGKYTFKVNKGTNKIEIKEAVEKIYKTKVATVNVLSVKGKKVRQGKSKGVRSDWKKAVVTLKKGETIAELSL